MIPFSPLKNLPTCCGTCYLLVSIIHPAAIITRAIKYMKEATGIWLSGKIVELENEKETTGIWLSGKIVSGKIVELENETADARWVMAFVYFSKTSHVHFPTQLLMFRRPSCVCT